MKFIKYLLYFVLGLAALIGVFGIFAKNTYHIERSIEIDAPRELVYEQIRFFKNFNEWSPWLKLDPNVAVTYEGADGEVGSSYSWSGNENVGKGKEILKALSADRIDLELQFIEPFESTIPAFFNVTGDTLKTKVSWGFDPHLPFPVNVWAMFTDIDKAMGTDYERGLAFLKRRCESIAHKKYNGYEIIEEEMSETNYFCAKGTVKLDSIHHFFDLNLVKVMEAANEGKLVLTGPPAGIYWSFDQSAGVSEIAVGVPVKEETVKAPKDFSFFRAPGGKALVVSFYGAYDSIHQAHTAIEKYCAAYSIGQSPLVIESYITDPATEQDTSKWLTKVMYFTAPDSTGKK
ncbi:MAG: SRPBCC family protein [Bacteroidota bacterium]|nr:SRPBCC family protein [Saprospiraceae bacterium]